MGCFFRNHDWVQIAKTASPAPKRMSGLPGFEATRMTSEGATLVFRNIFAAYERDSRSVTCFLFQCSVCKEIRKEELWGVVEERS